MLIGNDKCATLTHFANKESITLRRKKIKDFWYKEFKTSNIGLEN